MIWTIFKFKNWIRRAPRVCTRRAFHSKTWRWRQLHMAGRSVLVAVYPTMTDVGLRREKPVAMCGLWFRPCIAGAPLESVSLCIRFSGFLTISSSSYNRLSSKLVGMFFGIVSMFVAKDFVRDCYVAQIRAKMCVSAGIRAYLRDEATPSKIVYYEHWNYLKEHAYQF